MPRSIFSLLASAALAACAAEPAAVVRIAMPQNDAVMTADSLRPRKRGQTMRITGLADCKKKSS